MNALKRMLSLLLSVILILSVFTIIPMTASAETVQVFARKWVEADLETGDYFSFTDLYHNFIICRCNPDFDDTDYNVDNSSNVYNRTGTISLGGYNEIRLNSWNDGSGHLNFYTNTNSGAQGDGKIYLSTNGDSINFNTDGVRWFAYTWETFTVESVAGVSPTYDEDASILIRTVPIPITRRATESSSLSTALPTVIRTCGRCRTRNSLFLTSSLNTTATIASTAYTAITAPIPR